MRYIYYIIIIFLGLSAIIGYELRSRDRVSKDAAIIINDRTITVEEFNRLYSTKPPDMREKSDFINSLITKELLLQESKKTGIDREESFRRSIQNYYEQSLIKLLIDRKFATMHIELDENEFNRYMSLINRSLHITIFTFNTLEEAKRGVYREGERKTIFFGDLAKDMREHLAELRVGETSEPVKMGDSYVAVRLDRTDIIPGEMPSDTERKMIRKMLLDEKKEKAINDWIADLRNRASVKILINEGEQGEK